MAPQPWPIWVDGSAQAVFDCKVGVFIFDAWTKFERCTLIPTSLYFEWVKSNCPPGERNCNGTRESICNNSIRPLSPPFKVTAPNYQPLATQSRSALLHISRYISPHCATCWFVPASTHTRSTFLIKDVLDLSSSFYNVHYVMCKKDIGMKWLNSLWL